MIVYVQLLFISIHIVEGVEGRPYPEPLVGSNAGSARSERAVVDEPTGFVNDE